MRTARPLLFLPALICLAATPSLAQSGSPAASAADAYLQHPLKVAQGVWVLAQPEFQVQPAGNVTVIEQSDGLILVDTGGSPGAGRRVVETVRKLSRKPVTAVVVTHWHGDHVQGLSAILEAWPGARTIATHATQAHLRDPRTMNTPAVFDGAANTLLQSQLASFAEECRRAGEHATAPAEKAGWAAAARLFRRYAQDMDGALTLPVNEGFGERLLITDPSAPAEVLFLGRANTDGDAVVWLPKQRVLVAGDIVVAPIPFGYGGYPSEWTATLARLRAFDFAVLVPGHGRPQKDRAYIDALAAALGGIRDQVAHLASQGLAAEDIRTRIEAQALTARFAGRDPWLRRWFKTYWIDPIVDSALKEARGQAIVQHLGDS